MILFSWVKQRSNLLAVNLLKILCSFSLQNYIISSFLNLFNIVSDSIFQDYKLKKTLQLIVLIYFITIYVCEIIYVRNIFVSKCFKIPGSVELEVRAKIFGWKLDEESDYYL
jgi:hypothetical protein